MKGNCEVELIEVTRENVDKTGFFCYMSKKKSEGHRRKLKWVEERLAEGICPIRPGIQRDRIQFYLLQSAIGKNDPWVHTSPENLVITKIGPDVFIKFIGG